MNEMRVPRQSFGRYDRILIGKSTYRYIRRDENGAHVLQRAVDGLLENDFRRITDKDIAGFMRRKIFKVEPAYYSKALDELRARGDDSNLLALSEEQVRDVMWKTEWCVRFHNARLAPASTFRPKMTPEDLATFIEAEKQSMNRWYIRRYSEPRPLGRPIVVDLDADKNPIKERKPYDYPSPSALRNWLRLYSRTGERMIAFAPRYHRSGNRRQLDSELAAKIDACVRGYADLSRPTRRDIYDRVEVEITKLNRQRARQGLPPLDLVDPTTVSRRIAKLEPFYVDAGRLGPERAMRKYLLIGKGVEVDLPMERIEMDDWESDLHTIMSSTRMWTKMTKAQRAAVPRVRCTVTVAIDCRTRCIVGINVSEAAASTPASKAALKTITEDKTYLAKDAGSKRTWDMCGRPDDVFTDGGPVFQGEFREAVHDIGSDPNRPDPDPRQRGHIEAFFRFLRRSCRYFTGQTFSNVVEKGEYPSEAMASVTVEEFRRFIIRFIVDVYHNKPHRGLAGETPIGAWKRLTKKHGVPATITAAQRRAAFGFKQLDVAIDPHGVTYLGISYVSEHIGELLRKLGKGAKLNLVIDPEDLGDVFVQVPLRLVEHMQAYAPMQMHGEFLEVPAADDRFREVTLAERLLGNQGVLDFVKQSKKEGDDYRISANEALGEQGIRLARRIRLPTHALTQADYEKLVAKYRVKARQSTGKPAINDEPAPPAEDLPTDEDQPNPAPAEDDLGEVVGTAKRTRRIKPPKASNAPAAVAAPTPARPPAPLPPPAPGAPKPSRSINQGEDD